MPPLGESEAAVTDEPDAVAAGGNGFVAQTLAELRLVVWPSRQQLFSESVAVILMVSISAAAIAALDRFYGWASSQVFG
jgi:preprotein translocase subunit SecE